MEHCALLKFPFPLSYTASRSPMSIQRMTHQVESSTRALIPLTITAELEEILFIDLSLAVIC